jgi:hypothetical protein
MSLPFGQKLNFTRPKKVVMSSTFFDTLHEQRIEAQVAKFSQNKEAKRQLLATGGAVLLHWTRGKQPYEDTQLEEARELLRK